MLILTKLEMHIVNSRLNTIQIKEVIQKSSKKFSRLTKFFLIRIKEKSMINMAWRESKKEPAVVEEVWMISSVCFQAKDQAVEVNKKSVLDQLVKLSK